MNENKKAEKSSAKLISAIKVAVSIILTIAIATGIGWAFKTAFGSAKPLPQKADPNVKVNAETGAEEHYDKNGNLEYKVNKEYADNEKAQVAREIYSDAKDQTQKIVYYADGTKNIDRVDEYENGKVVLQHKYQNGTDTGEYSKFAYNEDGKETSAISYDKDGKELYKKEQEYNKDGKPVTYIEKDAEGNMIAKTEYNYDKDGKEIKTLFYDADGLVGYVEYEYDKDGRVTLMNQYKDGKLYDFRTYEYDKDGTCKETIHQPDEKK